jgi:hypothetical protein
MVGHRSRRDWEEAGFGAALPNQRTAAAVLARAAPVSMLMESVTSCP